MSTDLSWAGADAHIWRLDAIAKAARERILPRLRQEENGCWVWTGHVTPNGYGQVGMGRRLALVHRLMLELWEGAPLPEGCDVDHTCRNRACANPVHLEAVSRKENIRRGLNGVLKTHCKHGHPWVEENIIVRKNGERECRPCRDAYQKARRDRNGR